MCSRGHRAVFGFSLGLWLCLARHPASSPLGGSEVAGRAVLEGEGVSAWQGLLWVPGAWWRAAFIAKVPLGQRGERTVAVN